MMRNGLFGKMAAVCLPLLLSACGGSYFIMPEEGTYTTYKEVEADRNGHFMLKLASDCKGVVYRDFTITRNTDEPFPFRIYVGLNSRERAEWRVDPQNFGGQQLVCVVRRILLHPRSLPKNFDRQALGAFCASRYATDPDVVKFTTNPTVFCGREAIDYIVRIIPSGGDGGESLIHGIMLFSEKDPGVIIDISYTQTENGEYALKLREYGEQFLRMVKLHDK